MFSCGGIAVESPYNRSNRIFSPDSNKLPMEEGVYHLKLLNMSNLWPCFWSYDTPDSKQVDINSHCKSLFQASH